MLMLMLLQQVAPLLGTDRDEALALLQHLKWNKEKLLEGYLADAQKIRQEVGLPPINTTGSLPVSSCCRICYEPIVPAPAAAAADTNAAMALSCGHAFCCECYGQYLRVQLGEGPQCILTRCPEHKCQLLVTRACFQRLLPAGTMQYDTHSLRCAAHPLCPPDPLPYQRTSAATTSTCCATT